MIFHHGFSECATTAFNDICKIDFDLENTSIDPKENFSMSNAETWLGPQKFGDLSVIGVIADPVAFVVYHDGKEFRAYVPKDGNSYDLKSKAAGGNEDAIPRKFNIEAMKADVMKRIIVR